MVLNRRFLRVLTYLLFIISLIVTLLLLANRKRLLHLDDILAAEFLPDYFQPQSNLYIVDISIQSCRGFNRNSQSCGVPSSSSGAYGDVGKQGGWIRVSKDLYLGSSWLSKKYLSYKEISAKYYESNRANVVLDLTIAAPSDCAIRGNTQCIPLLILEQIQRGHVFNDEDLEKLKNDNKNEKLSLENRLKPPPKVKDDVNIKDDIDENIIQRRLKEDSHHNLKKHFYIPLAKELADLGWEKRQNNLWLKLGPATDSSLSGINVLFGEDAVDPRPDWTLTENSLDGIGSSSNPLPRVTFRRGSDTSYPQPSLRFSAAGKFKVLQVADLHFSTGFGECRDPVPKESAKGCLADPRTLRFLNQVLDLEKPDFIALTGDQVFGEGSPDPETALFKAVQPFIARQIPYAMVLGNHDDESTLSREEMMKLGTSLPYSLTAMGPEEVDGFGNYPITVSDSRNRKTKAAFYFLDSHSYSQDPKVHGYDFFKQSQIAWLLQSSEEILENLEQNSVLSMAFFHIPMAEYTNLNQPIYGQLKEGITASSKKTGMRQAFRQAGIQMATCGHDHANDFCLLDSLREGDEEVPNKVWLCFGGGSGEGGYGGYGGYIRRMRVFDFDLDKMQIKTWKRAENDPNSIFDEQIAVSGGYAVELLES